MNVLSAVRITTAMHEPSTTIDPIRNDDMKVMVTLINGVRFIMMIIMIMGDNDVM